MEITKVNIVDGCLEHGEEHIMKTFYLLNPNKDKLYELKQLIEERFDYQFEDDISDEEIKAAEEFNDDIWNHIYDFVEKNFQQLDICEYTINY